MRFGHVAIRVKDIDKMLEFYCKALGFEEGFRICNDDGSLRIVYVCICEGQYLELCLGGDQRPEFDDKRTLGVRHICFIVENIVKSKQEIEARGGVFDSEVMLMKDKNLAAYLFDPEGNKIEIVQTSPDSSQFKFENRD